MKRGIWIFVLLTILIMVILIAIMSFSYITNKKIIGNESSNLTSEESYEWEVKLDFYNKSYNNLEGYFNKTEIDFLTESILDKLNITKYEFNGYIVIISHIQRVVKIPEEGYLLGTSFNFTYNDGKKIVEPNINLSKYNLVTLYRSRILGPQMIPENDSNLSFCYKENDCAIVDNGCCAISNCNYAAINKKYVDYWYSKLNCSNTGCIGSVCMQGYDTGCKENTCILIPNGILSSMGV
ncbi:hypothetical protein HZA33_03235 [Candidatus Pacearchaeota archaeon]|nr:hypothetical protein [Candidatus Pacearchaeota archaeon]